MKIKTTSKTFNTLIADHPTIDWFEPGTLGSLPHVSKLRAIATEFGVSAGGGCDSIALRILNMARAEMVASTPTAYVSPVDDPNYLPHIHR